MKCPQLNIRLSLALSLGKGETTLASQTQGHISGREYPSPGLSNTVQYIWLLLTLVPRKSVQFAPNLSQAPLSPNFSQGPIVLLPGSSSYCLAITVLQRRLATGKDIFYSTQRSLRG